MIEVTRITIRNFKNLKDVTIKPKKFNVLIGPNGSGKTNFLEFFKLLRKIYVERNPYPFLEWDGYENVVWNHKRSLPIEFEIETVEHLSLTKFKKYIHPIWDIKTENEDITLDIFQSISATFCADNLQNLNVLSENIKVKIPELNMELGIKKSASNLEVKINDASFELKNISDRNLFFEIASCIDDFLIHNVSNWIDGIYYMFKRICGRLPDYAICKFKDDFERNIAILTSKYESLKITTYFENANEICRYIIANMLSSVYMPLLALFKMTYLFSPNLIEVKSKPKIFPIDESLKERGENTLDILAQIQLKEGKLPERIKYFVGNYFNGKLYFKGIAPGRLNLYLYDLNSKTEISKEHLPDGLIKLLVILTALEQNPSILLIDEIENSLHPELLEFIINVLREECEGCIFVTTHSPIVLNLIEPEEIFIFKPTDDGVKIKNLTEYKSKEEIMKELEELGITLGEKVFYGLT